MIPLLLVLLVGVSAVPVKLSTALNEVQDQCQDCKNWLANWKAYAQGGTSDDDVMNKFATDLDTQCPSFLTSDQCAGLSQDFRQSVNQSTAYLNRVGIAVVTCQNLPYAQAYFGMTIANPCSGVSVNVKSQQCDPCLSMLNTIQAASAANFVSTFIAQLCPSFWSGSQCSALKSYLQSLTDTKAVRALKKSIADNNGCNKRFFVTLSIFAGTSMSPITTCPASTLEVDSSDDSSAQSSLVEDTSIIGGCPYAGHTCNPYTDECCHEPTVGWECKWTGLWSTSTGGSQVTICTQNYNRNCLNGGAPCRSSDDCCESTDMKSSCSQAPGYNHTTGSKPNICIQSAECFPLTAMVELENGLSVPISALQIGDSVRTGPKEFEKIFFFSHKDLDASMTSVTISTLTATITLSSNHYLYLEDGRLVEARKIYIGDRLVLADGQVENVEEISRGSEQGLINPHTPSGKIIVNGILASTFSSNLSPTIGSILLLPLQFLAWISPALVQWFQDNIYPIIHGVYVHVKIAEYLHRQSV